MGRSTKSIFGSRSVPGKRSGRSQALLATAERGDGYPGRAGRYAVCTASTRRAAARHPGAASRPAGDQARDRPHQTGGNLTILFDHHSVNYVLLPSPKIGNNSMRIPFLLKIFANSNFSDRVCFIKPYYLTTSCSLLRDDLSSRVSD